MVTSTEAPGNYRLQAGGGEQGVDLGFSVNLPADVSQLERVSDDELKAVFGDTPFRLAHNRDEIDRSVNAGRVGRELFPYLIVLLAIVLALRASAGQSLLSRLRRRGVERSRAARAGRRSRPRHGGRNSTLPVDAHERSGISIRSADTGWSAPWRWRWSLLLTLLGAAAASAHAAAARGAVGLAAGRDRAGRVGHAAAALVHTKTKRQSATLVLLVDRSRSMMVADAVGGKTRWQLLQSAVDEALPALGRTAARIWRSRSTRSTPTCIRSTFRSGELDLAHNARRRADRDRRGAGGRVCAARRASGWPA